VLGALFERGRTGHGRLVEVSMLEAMSHFAIEPFAAYFALGQVPRSSDRPRLAQAYILHTADGGLIAIHLSSLEKFWQELLVAIEAPELQADARFSTRLNRIEHHAALSAALDERFKRRSTDEWVERLSQRDVPFAPVHPIDAVVRDPQVQHMGLIVPVEGAHGGTQAVRPAVQFDGGRATSVRTAPLCDEHGEAIRAALAGTSGWPALAAPPFLEARAPQPEPNPSPGGTSP
jgi:crotonobetainyl-CoA:carnitine CoA-transferase CaiB-like acyl-CoA transferase